MVFQARSQNRQEFPDKHILICEDDLDNQIVIAIHLRRSFSPQGRVQFSFVSGSMAAAGIISWCSVDLVILDFDMPQGNGADLMRWLQNTSKRIPVITFSEIEENNDLLSSLGATNKFSKQEVLQGKADSVIKILLGL